MAQMLDQGTQDYLNEKFENTNNKLDKVITTVDRIDGKVVEHDVRIALVETAQTSHLENHKKMAADKKFNVQQFISLLAIMVTIFLSFKYL